MRSMKKRLLTTLAVAGTAIQLFLATEAVACGQLVTPMTPLTPIEHVYMSPGFINVLGTPHHFMCIYAWSGTDYVVSVAGDLKGDGLMELEWCQQNMADRLNNATLSMNRCQYLEWKRRYEEFLTGGSLLSAMVEGINGIFAPFTWGSSKPCYQETVNITDLVLEVVNDPTVSRSSDPNAPCLVAQNGGSPRN